MAFRLNKSMSLSGQTRGWTRNGTGFINRNLRLKLEVSVTLTVKKLAKKRGKPKKKKKIPQINSNSSMSQNEDSEALEDQFRKLEENIRALSNSSCGQLDLAESLCSEKDDGEQLDEIRDNPWDELNSIVARMGESNLKFYDEARQLNLPYLLQNPTQNQFGQNQKLSQLIPSIKTTETEDLDEEQDRIKDKEWDTMRSALARMEESSLKFDEEFRALNLPCFLQNSTHHFSQENTSFENDDYDDKNLLLQSGDSSISNEHDDTDTEKIEELFAVSPELMELEIRGLELDLLVLELCQLHDTDKTSIRPIKTTEELEDEKLEESDKDKNEESCDVTPELMQLHNRGLEFDLKVQELSQLRESEEEEIPEMTRKLRELITADEIDELSTPRREAILKLIGWEDEEVSEKSDEDSNEESSISDCSISGCDSDSYDISCSCYTSSSDDFLEDSEIRPPLHYSEEGDESEVGISGTIWGQTWEEDFECAKIFMKALARSKIVDLDLNRDEVVSPEIHDLDDPDPTDEGISGDIFGRTWEDDYRLAKVFIEELRGSLNKSAKRIRVCHGFESADTGIT